MSQMHSSVDNLCAWHMHIGRTALQNIHVGIHLMRAKNFANFHFKHLKWGAHLVQTMRCTRPMPAFLLNIWTICSDCVFVTCGRQLGSMSQIGSIKELSNNYKIGHEKELASGHVGSIERLNSIISLSAPHCEGCSHELSWIRNENKWCASKSHCRCRRRQHKLIYVNWSRNFGPSFYCEHGPTLFNIEKVSENNFEITHFGSWSLAALRKRKNGSGAKANNNILYTTHPYHFFATNPAMAAPVGWVLLAHISFANQM